MSVVAPIGPKRTLEEMRDDKTTGLIVGTNGSGGVGIARMLNGDVMWCEDWTVEEAEGIARGILRAAQQLRSRR